MRTFVAIAIATALVVTGCSAARPLHRSEAHIRAALLKKTPIGTSAQDVHKFIKKEGWYETVETGRTTAYFGGYFICGFWGFAERDVFGKWTFDSNGRLIDIQVSKENDGL